VEDPTLLSTVLALIAALLYGLSGQIVRLGLNHLDARTGVTISSGTTALTYLLLAPLWLNWEEATNPVLLLFAALGFFHPLLSRYMAYEANRRVGATIASTFEAFSPLLSMVVAALFLHERPDPVVVGGTLIAVAGGVYIYWHPAVARSLMRTAILLAFGAMVLRSLNNIVLKVGLDLLPNPMMAAFTGYGVSWTIARIGLSLSCPRGTGPVARAGIAWFAFVGVITACASGCLYGALMHGDIVIVAPIMAAYPFFVMFTGWLLRAERLTARNVTGVLVVVAGLVLITIRVVYP
jgi:drug/metabolite transporter (DMT)-like permease